MIRTPKGVSDILPPRASFYSYIEQKAEKFFSTYGYHQIRIPTFENTQLFLRSVGEETDVGKQMYTFEDKGGRSISLRPEGTAGIARAYIEHKLYGKGKDWRVYYSGPMFRYERPQAGRLREFYQIGVECFGEPSPWVDAEIIDMAYRFLGEKLGLDNIVVQINSIGCKNCRMDYVQNLKHHIKHRVDDLCSTCRRRFQYNTLRVLDCKNQTCREVLEEAPQIKDFLCSSCREHFNKVKRELENLNISYTLNPYLVRGLDYYTRTIFEITSSYLGSQDAVCAGGRYDDLIQELQGPPTPAMGFAIGVERLIISLEKARQGITPPPARSIFVATIGEKSVQEGMHIARSLRSQGLKVKVNFASRSLSSQLKQADRENFHLVLIAGEDEVKKGEYIIRDMHTGEQQKVKPEHISETALKKFF